MFASSNTMKLKRKGILLHYYGQIQAGRLHILFVHGASGNGTLWHHQLQGLFADYAPLAVDLPGHGRSEGEAQNRIPAYRDDLKDFKDSAGLPKVVLCGHSMGGAVVLDYALNHPEDIEALVLISSGGKLRVAPQLLETYRSGQKSPSLVQHLYGSQASEELVRAGADLLEEVPTEVSYADFSACDAFNVKDRLYTIDLPVLILCGEQDVMTPPKYSRFLAENIPGARLELFPESGHMLMQEQGDLVNQSLKKFLQEIQAR